MPTTALRNRVIREMEMALGEYCFCLPDLPSLYCSIHNSGILSKRISGEKTCYASLIESLEEKVAELEDDKIELEDKVERLEEDLKSANEDLKK